ncbi:hypothetical protein [Craterilacuibacter sinensis]|uniref:Uncharacterized protein n=1 Tax=Craterilacuibacter sinensis TaxID=2686017 RepID=A0A845BNS1_9NEIS|nr:hypothetical protein [Craterilacuibacter sinensis]MXR38227.1 hypothetical protein [Craterilacuibacter sinensis]
MARPFMVLALGNEMAGAGAVSRAGLGCIKAHGAHVNCVAAGRRGKGQAARQGA